MATLKQRMHKKNSSGTYDTVHLETSSSLVLRPSGRTVEQDLADYLPKTQASDTPPSTLKSGQLISGPNKAFYGGYNDSVIDLSNASSLNGHTYDDILALAGPYKYSLLRTYDTLRFNFTPPTEGLYLILVRYGYTCTESTTATVTHNTSIVASADEGTRNYVNETFVTYHGNITYNSSATLITYPFKVMIIAKYQSWILQNLTESVSGFFHSTGNYTYQKCDYLYAKVEGKVRINNLEIKVYQVT